jgi:chromate transporter
MSMRKWGSGWQLLGCVVGLFFIFLPSALLVLFFYPIWNNLKKYAVVYRSLEGINAVVVGIMVASTFYLFRDITMSGANLSGMLNIAVMGVTFFLLTFTRLPSPFIVIFCLALGAVM